MNKNVIVVNRSRTVEWLGVSVMDEWREPHEVIAMHERTMIQLHAKFEIKFDRA